MKKRILIMSCACSVNPGKCRMKCKHKVHTNNCFDCNMNHYCICGEIHNQENKYIDKRFICRAKIHDCIDSDQCINEKCSCIIDNVEIINDIDMCIEEGCDKPAILMCPVCHKFNMKSKLFCSTNCFRKGWKYHNKIHKKISRFKKEKENKRNLIYQSKEA